MRVDSSTALRPTSVGDTRSTRLLTLIIATAAAVASSACSTSDTTTTSGHTVTDSAGVRVVLSTNATWGAEPATLDSTPVVQVASEASGAYQFTFVWSGVLLADGRIALGELGSNEVRVFSADGVHMKTWGRRGMGPGEFQSITRVLPYLGDSLLAYDQSLRRTTILPIDSGTPRVIVNPVDGNLDAFGRLEGGQLLLYNPGGSYHPGVAPGLWWDTTDVAQFDLSDGSARVLARLPSRQQYIEPDGNTRPLAPAHSAIHAASRDGFYWGTSDRYEIREFDANGQLRQILRRPLEPRVVDPSMIERWIDANLENVRRFQGEGDVESNRRRLEAGERGTQVPLFQEAFVDQNDRLWVGESVWPALDMSSSTWSVFADDGVWLGDVHVPTGFRILDSRDDLVLGVWPDENDVPHVQVRRLLIP